VPYSVVFGYLSSLDIRDYHHCVAQYIPCTLTVYASTFPLPVRSQDSLLGVGLGLTQAGLSPARHCQLILAHSNLVYAYALLKATPSPRPAVFREGSPVRQGQEVMVAGFPLHGLLADEPNVTTGTIAALAGPGNDTRLVQITAPMQPGNSGGPLLDESSHVVGVVVGKLDAIGLAAAIGDIPQNINFAINAATARAFLDANGVSYQTAGSDQKVPTADIAERARGFTVLIECWK